MIKETFSERAKHIHGNKFNYDKAIYVKSNEKVIIHCNKCNNDFLQTPHAHLRGQGCPYCRGLLKTTKTFIEQAVAIHGDKYDYGTVNYIDSQTKIKIFCKDCKKYFLITPNNHLRKRGCPHCRYKRAAEALKRPEEEFIVEAKKIHGDKYDYADVKYINNVTPVKITCNTCGNVFMSIPSNHLKGKGCKKCAVQASANKLRMTREEFIERATEIYGDAYDYSEMVYKNAESKIKITCKKHNIAFYQRAYGHLSGLIGCTACKQKSKGEQKILTYLEQNDIKFIHENIFSDCINKRHLRFDFYLPDYNTCIEFQGRQHYCSNAFFGGQKAFLDLCKRDAIKKRYCKDNNILLLEIKYNDNIDKVLENFFKAHSPVK